MASAERVLPEPEMQLKRMKPGMRTTKLRLNTRRGEMQAAMVAASLVKMLMMGVGKINKMIQSGMMAMSAI